MNILCLRTLPLLAVSSLAFLLGTANAATVTPSSYTFDQPTSNGSYTYSDPSFSKLKDGTLGTAGWASNSGLEWVGWLYTPVVNIDFNFGAAKRIDSVSVGTTQDSLGDVVLPSVKVYESNNLTTWSLVGSLDVPASNLNNVDSGSTDPHGFLTLSNLGINEQYVRVALLANGIWIFADEVSFQGSGNVPEPATLALLGLAGLGLVRRRKQA